MVEDISDIANKLKYQYNIDEDFYPNISLLRTGGIEEELKVANKLASEYNIECNLEFYKEYFEQKKNIIEFISKDKHLQTSLKEYSKDLTGADIQPIFWLASGVLMLLYQSIAHPYLKSYFGRLGELKAEEKQKQKEELKSKIKESIQAEFKYKKDRELVEITVNKYIEKEIK